MIFTRKTTNMLVKTFFQYLSDYETIEIIYIDAPFSEGKWNLISKVPTEYLNKTIHDISFRDENILITINQ